MSRAIHVAVTGAAGQLAYSLLFPLAEGEVFGPEQPIVLRLLEITPVLPSLKGTVMEIADCAYPLVEDIVVTDNAEEAFRGVNWALLVGSKPRGKGQERKDLIRENGPIFVGQGKALDKAAADDVRILVVGNPCNTNCLIAQQNARRIPPERWFAMTQLDHNRAVAQLAAKAGTPVRDVSGVTIWGNHSATLYADASQARVRGRPAAEAIADRGWLQGEFIATVRQRGAQVIEARGKSSAASAAKAAMDHVRFFLKPSPAGTWTSAAVVSDGSYGVPKGLVSSFPVRSTGRGWEIVGGLPVDAATRAGIDLSVKELIEERDTVANLLG
jgi:malate dehydrogenase